MKSSHLYLDLPLGLELVHLVGAIIRIVLQLPIPDKHKAP